MCKTLTASCKSCSSKQIMREIALFFFGKSTQLAQILHDCRSWRSRQISTLYIGCFYISKIKSDLQRILGSHSEIIDISSWRLNVVIWNTGNFEEQFYDMNWGVLILSCLVTLFLKRKADNLVKLSSLPKNSNQFCIFSAISE